MDDMIPCEGATPSRYNCNAVGDCVKHQKSVKGCEDLQCNKNQRCSLESDRPICVAVECHNIKYLQNGVIFGGHVTIGAKRGFRCNHGYNLIGSKAITCQPDGSWSAAQPTCLLENPHTLKPTTTSTFKAETTVRTDVHKTPEVTTTSLPTATSTAAKTRTPLQQTTASTWIENQNYLGPGQFNSPCGRNSDCLHAFFQCRQNVCKCVFGTVYHRKSGECIKDCAVADETFQKFINISMSVEGGPMAVYDRKSDTNCINICLHDERCTMVTTVWDRKGILTYSLTDNIECYIYNNTLRQIKDMKQVFHTTYLRDCKETTSSSEKSPDKDSGPTAVSATTTRKTTITTQPPVPQSPSGSATKPASLVPGDDKDKQTTGEITSVTSTATETTPTSTSEETTIESREKRGYLSAQGCSPGFVFSYHANSCQNDCRQNAETFQKYSRMALDFTQGRVGVPIEIKGLELTKCLDECFDMISCIAVVFDHHVTVCSVIRGYSIPLPEFFINADSSLFVRDCLEPTNYNA